MKYIKLIILAAFLSTMFTGCSYVSDSIEGRITDRASFTATAEVNGNDVIITWDKIDTDQDFAGIEIYRSKNANDEYAEYGLIASKYYPSPNILLNENTIATTYTDVNIASTLTGVYFYRVAFIYWDKSRDERTIANGYSDPDNPSETNYYDKTSIDAISDYAKAIIP